MTASPSICVSIATPDAESCLKSLRDVETAEIRLDAMQVTEQEVRRLFASPARLIATCRPGVHDAPTRRRLLLAAIDAGAWMVDSELDSPAELRTAILHAARSSACRTIISFHDHAGTPPRGELCELRRRCFDAGADWAKLACHVGELSAAARLLGLLDGDGRTIVVGMGVLGRIVRIAAPLLGSPLAYACPPGGTETAPGQLDRVTLERLLKDWSDG